MNNKPFKTYAPFGVATKRFTKIGFHPELDKSGAMKKKITELGPGSFNPSGPQCKSKQGMSWQRKLELEEFSTFLGYKNSKILRERQFAKTMRGPGSTDVNEEVFKQKTSAQKENVGFGSSSRFGEKAGGQNIPPPDTYFRHIAKSFEQSKKTFSKLPTFEFDGLAGRFKSDEKTYHLPSNLYNRNDRKNVSDITRKVVSARGPYDCFTGPRDGTTIKNHFTLPLTRGPDYYYIKPSDIQILATHPSKKRYGVFLKGPRFQKKPTLRHMLNDISLCYRSPKDPGPAHYDVENSSIQHLPPGKYPFNSSNVYARPPLDWKISPGPGRYHPKASKCMKLKKPSWVFLSKTNGRCTYKVPTYSLF